MASYAFGPYVLDLSSRQLRRHDRPVEITAKSFETLVVLVRNRGRVITKEELLLALWPDTVVEEANLAQNISTLRRILQDTPKEHRFIATIPGRGYSFVASVTENDSQRAQVPEIQAQPVDHVNDLIRQPFPFRVLWMIGAISVLACFLLLRVDERGGPPASYSSVPLTGYVGHEFTPSFSPEGQAVAFAWDGPERDNFDIYVRRLNTLQPVRLTHDVHPDISPAWSPDGRTLAYLHVLGNSAEVLLMPVAANSSPRKLGTAVIQGETYYHLRYLSWSRDGQFLAISYASEPSQPIGVYLLSTQTGAKRRLTSPPSAYDDFDPIFSPDMKSLAFVRYSGTGASAGDLYVLDLSAELEARGDPRRMTAFNGKIASPAWTPDGRSILLAKYDAVGGHSLWRLPVRNPRRVEPLPIAADNSSAVTISPTGHEIVYTRDTNSGNLWSITLRGGSRAGNNIGPWTKSTSMQANPQFSPDGKYVAFQSWRSGKCEIWVCDRDGSNARQLTNLGAIISGFPRWSPDGRKIVFHSRPSGSANLFLIDVAGGEPKRLTSGIDNDLSPSWSRDGRWIYYSSKRRGEPQIWRIPAQGGTPEPVARHDGYCPLESKDGRYLYFASLPDHALWRVALLNGHEEKVLPNVAGAGSAYVPAREGIYFIRAFEQGKKQELAFLRYATRGIERIVGLPGDAFVGLGLSPDERLLLYAQMDQSDTDLMLVRHFH